MNEHEEITLAALAGLLHDVGKFAQRAQKEAGDAAGIEEPQQVLSGLIPPAWADDVNDAIAHHRGDDTRKLLTQAVEIAGQLAASKWIPGVQTPGEIETTALIPIPALVTLAQNSGTAQPQKQSWGYPLNSKGAVCFPEPGLVVNGYPQLWQRFAERIKEVPQPVDSFARMMGLMDALADTTAYIPAATPWEDDDRERAMPDIPLLQQAHLTAAIAVCLMRLNAEDVENLHRLGQGLHAATTPVGRLVKADFSGIQTFIYRITEPASDRSYRYTAKRLRARSLHLALLNQAVGEWLLKRLNLPPTQLLYAGGGIIEWLLPCDVDFATPLTELAQALFDEPVFNGALGLVWNDAILGPADFADIHTARTTLESNLGSEKERKASRLLQTPGFFAPETIFHVCQICGLTPTDREGQICRLCRSHENVGGALPKAAALAQVHQLETGMPLQAPDLVEPLATIGGALRLLSEDDLRSLRTMKWDGDLLLRGINQFPEELQRPDLIPGRWNIANAAPILDGTVLDFEQIAALSRGTPLLGILKADADRMGLIFSRGIHPPSFSRTMALSATIHRFFGEYLNQLCETVTSEWRAAVDQPLLEALERRHVEFSWQDLKSIFYVLYAGGDDLFVVGPWDAMIDLALKLQSEYRRYTCSNDEFGLSAGLIAVKPHVPIHQFAHLVDEEEKQAKNAGRNRLALFGQVLEWSAVEAMIQQGKIWSEQINTGNGGLPRGLFHDLGRMFEQPGADINLPKARPMVTPTLYYTLVRRLRSHNEEQIRELAQILLNNFPDILVALEYAILTTRKE